MIRWFGIAALASAFALSLVACPSTNPLSDVLLVTVDTLRPDHLGLYGYTRDTSPQVDRWFADAAVFHRAYATEASTPPSVASLLTGLLPQQHRVRMFYQLLPPQSLTLGEKLPPSYQTAAFVSNIVLTNEAMGMAERFDHYDDFVDEQEPSRVVFERNARRTTDAALTWLHGDAKPSRPLFLWVHYIDPHGPYRPPADAVSKFEHEGSLLLEPHRVHAYQLEPEVADALDYVDRYDEEIAYVDHHIGRLLDGVAELRGIEDSLVIFTADHGESMLERELWFTHGYHVYEEIVRVPLLVRGPGVAPGPRRDLASGIDIAPTVLEFAGARPVRKLPGRSLISPLMDDDPTIFVEAGTAAFSWRAALRGDSKWLVSLRKGRNTARKRLFYDLARDPGEEHPQAWPPDSDTGNQLEALYRMDPDPGGVPLTPSRGRMLEDPKVDPRADERALEALRALGYVQ
jgi:arylsulfatase A-like enzyme